MSEINPPDPTATSTTDEGNQLDTFRTGINPVQATQLGQGLRESAIQREADYSDPAALDVTKGVLNAPFAAITNTVGAVNDLTGSPLGNLGSGNVFGDTTTMAGGIAQGLSQFAVDMYATAGAFKAVGLADKIKALKYGKFLLPSAEGAAADFTAFPGNSGRMSDLLWRWGDQHPTLRNSVTDFLRSKDGDSDAEGRLKNVLEGFGLGQFTNLAFKSLRLFKAFRGGEAADGAIKSAIPPDLDAIKKSAAELEPEIEAFMSGEKSFPSNISPNTAKAVFMRIGNLTADQADGALAPFKAFADTQGVSLGEALSNKVGLYKRNLADYAAAGKTADSLLESKDPAFSGQVSRLLMGGEDVPRLEDGSINSGSPFWSMLKERVRTWMSPWAGSGTAVTVNSLDDLKSLYKLIGMSDSEASDAIDKASTAAFGVNKSNITNVLDQGGVKVMAQDLKNPVGNIATGEVPDKVTFRDPQWNFGLAKRLQDAQSAIQSNDSALRVAGNEAAAARGPLPDPDATQYQTPQALAADKVAKEVASLRDMAASNPKPVGVPAWSDAFDKAQAELQKGQYSEQSTAAMEQARKAAEAGNQQDMLNFLKEAEGHIAEDRQAADAQARAQLKQQIEGIKSDQAGVKAATDYTNSLAAGSPFNPLNQLWQHMDEYPSAAKGVTDFVNDGKAIISLFEGADATTFIHELSHIVRRWMPTDELQALSNKLGVKDWQNWTRPEEENFANLMTNKILNGESSSPALDAMVGKTSKLIGRVYSGLRDSAIGGSVSPSIKQAFETDNAAGVGTQPVVALDQKGLDVAGQLVADAVAKGEPFDKSIVANGINLFHYDASDSILKLAGTVSEFVEDHVAPYLKDVENRDWVMKTAQDQAQQLGMSTNAYVARMGEVAGKTGGLSTEIAKSRILLATVVQDFSDAAAQAGDNGTTDSLLRFVKAKDQVVRAMKYYRETSANIARSLGIFQADVKSLDRVDQLERLIQEGGTGNVKDMVDDVNRINKLTPDADKLFAIRTMVDNNKFWGTVVELRQGAMLGAGSGFAADAISNAFKTLTMPLERAIASGFIGDTNGIYDALGIYKALGNHLYTSWKAIKASLDAGTPILDRSMKYEYPKYIKASTYGLQGTIAAGAIDTIGKVVRIFPAIRMAADEFFKTLNYRAFLESGFTRQALDMGLKGDDINAFVRSNLLNSVDETGRGVVTPAVRYAEASTFSTPHVDDFAAKVIETANQYPFLKIITPFIKTPINIFTDTVGHTPLIGALLKEQRAALAQGITSDAARQVFAKWTLGGSLIAAATYAWQGGYITGRGSSDPAVQAQLRLSGWQPYSFVYTGADGKKNYVGFNKIEPWGSIASIVADYADLAHSDRNLDLSSAAVHMTAAVSRNALNKTYLKGIADFVDAMSQPDKNMQNYLASLAGSFVPGVLHAFDNDPYIREAQGVLDGVKRKVPGWSETLMPKRNILGEPIPAQQGAILPDAISPFAFSQSTSDPVKNELAALSQGLSQPQPVRYGIDYRDNVNPKGQTAYDRLLELTGVVRDGSGQNLPQTLNKLIGSKDYQALVKGGDPVKDYRIHAVTNVLAKYHTMAEEALMKERPDLAKQVNMSRQQKAQEAFAAVQHAQTGQQP